MHALVRPLPSGDPRAWLVGAALARPDTAAPHTVLGAAGDGCLAVVVAEPSAVALAEADGALLAEPDVRWVGGHGVGIVSTDGRPSLVTYARMRTREGRWWCRLWRRLPGVPPEADSGEDHEGGPGEVPASLGMVLPEPVPGRSVLRGSATRGMVPIRQPDLTLPLPDGAAFSDAVQAAAHRLEARFVETGRPLPALVAWAEGGVEAWVGAGSGSAGHLHGLGMARGEDPSVRALGLFGLGEDTLDGRRVPMVALAMQARSGGSVLWLRRFERPRDGRARWLDPVGLIRSPGPALGFFGGSV